MKKIGIIGYGYVGKAFYEFFKNHYEIYVYDNNGNLIDSDTDYTDNCVCTWTPRWTGNFRIRVVNRGNVYNQYILRTN